MNILKYLGKTYVVSVSSRIIPLQEYLLGSQSHDDPELADAIEKIRRRTQT